MSLLSLALPYINVPVHQFAMAAIAGISLSLFVITKGKKIEFLLVFIALAFFLFSLRDQIR